MNLLFGLITAFALIIFANLLAQRQQPKAIAFFDLFLLLMNLPFILLGLLVAISPQQPLAQAMLSVGNAATGWVLLGMGLWGAAVSYHPIRRLLAHALPIKPASPVHTLALVLSGYLMGNTLLVLAEGGLEMLADTAVSVSITEFVLQQLLFAVLAFLGVGLFIRRSSQAAQERLGLAWPTRQQFLTGLRWIPVLVVLQWIIAAIWYIFSPEQVAQLNDVNSSLLGDMNSAWEWFALSLSAGIGEELLFRGALQPVFGLWFTAVVFAASHIQYGLTPATLAVFLIAIALGHIRQGTNTTVAIFVHFGYNFIIGLLSLLATYVEPFIQ